MRTRMKIKILKNRIQQTSKEKESDSGGSTIKKSKNTGSSIWNQSPPSTVSGSQPSYSNISSNATFVRKSKEPNKDKRNWKNNSKDKNKDNVNNVKKDKKNSEIYAQTILPANHLPRIITCVYVQNNPPLHLEED